MTFKTEFPDYPASSLPDLTGWVDTSWHNDICPSFCMGQFLTWIDWPDNTDRDVPGGHRYIVCPLDKDGCLTGEEPVLETDDWEAVLQLVQGHQR